MKLSEQQQIFTFNLSLLIQYAYGLGVKLTVGEAYRTPSQVLLNYFGYDVVREGKSIALKKRKRTSWTLNSKHPERMAKDFNFFIEGKLVNKHEKIDLLGDFWESLHPRNEWGGRWLDKNGNQKDPYHFQMNKVK
ncbi:hypothetical protein [Aquimarina macrocephali]|uniref:hypothetical protein n=1 Tax=Aquimarina macrocephali TaxID=666563 RepID=UPI003F67A9DA